MKKQVLFIMLWGLVSSAMAQSGQIDRLWSVIKTHPQADTFRVNRLNDLTNEWGLKPAQYDSLAKQALALARRLGYKEGAAQALFTMGISMYSTSRNDPARQKELAQSQQLLDQALQLAEESGDKRLLISLLMNVSASKRMSNAEKKQALPYNQRALALANSLHDSKLVSDAQRMIGFYYSLVEGNYAAALQWDFRALQTARQGHCQACELSVLRAIADNYTALNNHEQGLSYLNQLLKISRQSASRETRDAQFYCLSAIGNLHRMSGRYTAAIDAYKLAIRVRQVDYPTTTLAFFDKQLAAVYELRGQYKLAISHALRGLMQSRQEHNSWGESAISNTLSRAYLHTSQLDSALFYGTQSFSLAAQTHKKEYIRDASQTLAELYARQGKFADAYRFQGLFYSYRDSLTNEEANRKATAAQFTYQIGQQQSQLRLQAQVVRQQRFERNALLMGGILLLVLAIAISAWLLNRSRLRRLQEAQTLRKQIAHDLHDEVGSTLSSISLLSGMVNSLIAQNRPESVERAIQKINADARQILDAIDEIIWTINPGNDTLQRIAFRLQEYAQPLMESRNIDFSFVSDPALEGLPIAMEVRRNLYLIGKEAINNLVKYADATRATIRFERKDRQLRVSIEDNGRGFDATQPSQRTGQTSMRQRAEAMGGSLEVRSAPDQGTSLVLITSLAS